MARFYMQGKVEWAKDVVRTDTTTNRVKSFVATGAPRLPSAAGQYLLDKFPIVQWLPRYHPSWLIQDFMAGLTIGVLLIPQGLAYAKIVTIPIENGLYSGWIPAVMAVLMGTSKDLSSGPTSVLGLLTSEIVRDLSAEYSPTAIASAVAFMVGVYNLVLGLFGLGFLLEFVSVPVLTGFISATSLIIGFGQLGSLVGLSDTPDGIFSIIGYVLQQLPQWDGPTCAIGFGTVAILLALEKIGKTWGKKNFVIKYIASSRAVFVMVLFTLVSFFVNKDRGAKPLWSITKVKTRGIAAPKSHDIELLIKVASRAFAPLVACALEHLAVGKAFGRRNGYSIDQTQELNYLGFTNVINSFFSVMPISGAMSRTAVNSECRVKSPLNGIVTAGFILLTIYVLSPALFWLPKATLSATIIMAVVHLFGPVSLFYRYWRVSFADFVASMLSFWMTVFVSAEIGIGIAVAWSIIYTLLRYAFVTPLVQLNDSKGDDEFSPPSSYRPAAFSSNCPEKPNGGVANFSYNFAPTTTVTGAALKIPSDTIVIRFTDALFFPNAQRGKGTALEAVQLVYDETAPAAAVSSRSDRERSWSVATAQRIQRLRKTRGGSAVREEPLAVVVIDFTMMSFVDVTAVLALGELKEDIRGHCGPRVQFRVVGMTPAVRERFDRAEWPLTDLNDGRWRPETDVLGTDVVYPTMEDSLQDRRGSVLEAVVSDKFEM
ncbi:sulfate permease [Apiospora rasikravindrae]|uniref:Sulfate permease n=1 Tax=Apiospora rasikravindrae TaxID=990691 RepID=A0ABR1UBB5_9PEZI